MTTFPTSSSAYAELVAGQYDTALLGKAVRAAIKDHPTSSTEPPSSNPPTKGSDLFHLHSFTSEITLQPPEPTLQYWGRNPSPNPEFEAFTATRTFLRDSHPALTPLPLLLSPTRPLRSPSQLQRPHMALWESPGSADIHLAAPSNRKPLATLQLPKSEAAKEWLANSNAWDTQHWMHAVLSLDPDEPARRTGSYRDAVKRFHLRPTLAICWVPDGEGAEAGAEVKLLLTVEVFLDVAKLNNPPLPVIGQDLAGFIMHSLVPSPTLHTVPRSSSESRTAALRQFFDCLRPAPDLPYTFSAKLLQPQEMVSKLLPFQRRTVAVLLQREGSNFVSTGDKTQLVDPGMWTSEDLGGAGGRVAYRRITGEVLRIGDSREADRKGKGREYDGDVSEGEMEGLPKLLDISGVRGTMLCEEMGLGKTVEAIALVLLHRHPLSTRRKLLPPAPRIEEEAARDGVPVIDLAAGAPDLDVREIRQWVEAEKKAFEGESAWDPEAQLNVTEVGTTLIVTPPSLLNQWVTEMQRHAPSLRVCVYDGWKSLQKAVERRQAVLNRAFDKRAAESKKRKNETFRRDTVRKYVKGSDGQRIKVEDGVDSENAIVVNDILPGERESLLDVTQREFVDYVRAHDVVVTTYGNLSDDLKVALPAPSRSRRSNANYRLSERPRSPLVMVEWWRVIMDEVQLCGDTTTAANMVSLIPRRNSLAVSGTPAKSDIKDLMGSLRFLRVPLLPYNGHLWHRIQQPSFLPAFQALFRAIAVRTTKRQVSAEFDLPSQSRFVVPIELSQIELHYYTDALDRQREALHLPQPGQPRPEGWVLDRALFRACLKTLRQICTHIQVGALQREGFAARVGDQRLNLGRELMTMSEALGRMREDHWQEYLNEHRMQMRSMIRKAQLLIMDETDDTRYLNAVLLYEKVRSNIEQPIKSVRGALDKALAERAESEEDEEDDTPERHLSQQERAKRTEIQVLRTHIREFLVLAHQSWFFEGDVRHVQKEEDKEVECYERADAIRKEILLRPLQTANNSIGQLTAALEKPNGQAITSLDPLLTAQTKLRGGLQTTDTIEQANDLLQIMNDNAVLVHSWREAIIRLLKSSIEQEGVPEDQGQEIIDPEKEQYALALKAQGDVEAYLIAYAAALADRREFMLEERSLLATHDARVTKKRVTKAAQNAMEDGDLADAPDEVQEQAGILMAERQAMRDARVHKGCERPLKGLVMDLNAIVHGQNRVEEVAIAKRMASFLKGYIDEQKEIVDKLLKELDLFRKTFNRRVVYFAALQEISDGVSAPEFKNLKDAIQAATRDISEREVRLARMTVKGRYLTYLGTREQGEEELRDDCIICMGSSDDKHAMLLECGHFFCLSCYREFRKSVQGRRCPACRVEINDRGTTRIKLAAPSASGDKPLEAHAELVIDTDVMPVDAEGSSQEVPEEVEADRRAKDLERLKMLGVERRREIALMDMMGEFGSKINFLIKHLLYYRAHEPDARHVIFSNWSDSLNIVVQALRANRMSFVSFDQGRKQKDVVNAFHKDRSISVFLLHAERESSGLTLTSCRVVHLLEPVLSHSFELQAIGRVDRLGQEKQTTVYCYATTDTVESRILCQGVRNGTSIYLKEDEGADEVVASMPNVVSAAHKGGDLSNDGGEEDLLGLIL